MSWVVTGDVGERGPAIDLNVFEWLHNIQTKRFFNSVKRTGPCLREHGPAINLNVFEWLHNNQTKKFFNTVKGTGPCLGELGPALNSNVFETFHTIQTRNFFNLVNWAGPCLGEHDQPFIWTLLKVCITSGRRDFSTPRFELGRDKGCWGARLSYSLECFWMVA